MSVPAYRIDAGPLADLAARFMDEMEEEYGEDAALVDAVIAVEISAIDEGGDPVSIVEARSIDKRNTAAIGIVERAREAMQ